MASSHSDDSDSSSLESDEEIDGYESKNRRKLKLRKNQTLRTSRSPSSSASESSSSSDEEEIELFDKLEVESENSELIQGNSSDATDIQNNSKSGMTESSQSLSGLPLRSSSCPSAATTRKKKATVEEESLETNDDSSNDKGFSWVGPVRISKNDAWDHMGFKKFPNKPIDRTMVFCKLCGHILKYQGSSTNMKVHLLSKHPHLIKDVEVNQPRASSYFSEGSKKIQHKYPSKHPKNKKAKDALVKWFCKRDRPFISAWLTIPNSTSSVKF